MTGQRFDATTRPAVPVVVFRTAAGEGSSPRRSATVRRFVTLCATAVLSAAFVCNGVGSAAAHDSEGFTHDMAGAKAPTLRVDIDVDKVSGYNITLTTTRFRWTPQRASSDHVAGEGHAHVYLDDKRLLRLYTPAFHLDTAALEPGAHQLRIVLNGNDHVAYSADGEMVEYETPITVTAPPATNPGAPEPHDVFAPVPVVALSVTADPVAGFNVELTTENFTWTPQNVSSTHVDGEGHARMYVDDVLTARLYGPAYHLDLAGIGLLPGTYSVRVELVGNDHGAYRDAGRVVEASAQVRSVEAPQSVKAVPTTDDDTATNPAAGFSPQPRGRVGAVSAALAVVVVTGAAVLVVLRRRR